MKMTRPSPEQLLLTQRRHYLLLTVGLVGIVIGLAMLLQHGDGWQVMLAGGALWTGFSSGHGTMLLDRSTRMIRVSKQWWGITRRSSIPFAEVRYGEAARFDRNEYFRLVLRGGGTAALASSASMIDNAAQVADAVNEFLGVSRSGGPAGVVAAPLTIGQQMVADPAFKAEVMAHKAEALQSDAMKASLAGGVHSATPAEVAALKAAGEMSQLDLQSTPSGADLLLDRLRCGRTPLVFAVRRHGATPRIITFQLAGYNPVQKHVLPDGRDVSLNIKLEAIG